MNALLKCRFLLIPQVFTIALEQAVRNWLQSNLSLSGKFVESETTVVVGDFGQDATNEHFSAYTFLFLPAEQLPPWQERIRLFRENEYREGGNFEFKAVGKRATVKSALLQSSRGTG